MAAIPELFVEFDSDSDISIREQYESMRECTQVGIKLGPMQLFTASRSSVSRYNTHPLFFDLRLEHDKHVMLEMLEFVSDFNTVLVSVNTMTDTFMQEIIDKAESYSIKVVATTVDPLHGPDYCNRFFGMGLVNVVNFLITRAREINTPGYMLPSGLLDLTKGIREKVGGFAFVSDVRPEWYHTPDELPYPVLTPADAKKKGAQYMSCSGPVFSALTSFTPVEAIEKLKEELASIRIPRPRTVQNTAEPAPRSRSRSRTAI